MRSDDAPVRLVEDPNASPALRSMVSQARGELPTSEEMEGFSQRVNAAIAAGLRPSVTAAPRARGSMLAAPSGKALLGTVVLAVSAAGILSFGFGARGNVHQAASALAPLTSKSPVVASASLAFSSASFVSPIGTSPNNAATAVALTQPHAQARSRGAAVDAVPNKLESALLESARAVLRTDPKRALQLTEEHEKRFPNGHLSQEREVIAIDALNRLGKRDAAKSRGAAFGQRFPDSAHQPRLQQSLK